MKPAPFLYVRPDSVDEAVAILAEHGDEARVLAGGQSLVPMLNLRLARPGVLVDFSFLTDLAFITSDDGAVLVGAMTRQGAAERSDDIAALCPLLAAAISHIGHPQIRSRGTVGGSLAHADPAAELPAVALVLEADFVLENAEGTRTVGSTSFFEGPFTTSLRPGELLREVSFPATGNAPFAFLEVARRHGDFAIAGVAALAMPDGVRLSACGVGWAPIRLTAAEAIAATGPLNDEVITEAAAAARDEVDPPSDIHGDSGYRRTLIDHLVTQALREVRA